MFGVAVAFGAGAEPINRDIIFRLNDLQRRRVPDGVGLWSSHDSSVVLGHRRMQLSTRVLLAPNPCHMRRIYNDRVLRQELSAFSQQERHRGVDQRGCPMGEAALRKLRGVYAFALWDSLERELWHARDPYGI